MNAGVTLNGKRFTFRQNDYILRTSGILGVIHMENFRKVKDMMIEMILEIAGIMVTIISIIVTISSMIQSHKTHKHQKSNRPHQG